jgi:hypothetical protein
MSVYVRSIGVLACVEVGFIAILIAAPHGSAVAYTAVALLIVSVLVTVWCAWLEDRSHS